MSRRGLMRIAFMILFFAYSLPKTWAYVGENLGFDFYSVIDAGNYSIQEKLLTRQLADTPTFESFAKNCIGKSFLMGIPMDEKILRELENMDYSGFSRLLAERKISTDEYTALTRCLADNYTNLRSEVIQENEKRQKITYLGLYMDGDTTNSSYDIIADIEKINGIIFSTPIKYSGVRNSAAKSLSKILDGFLPPPLMGVITASGVTVNPITTSGGTILTIDTDGDGIADMPDTSNSVSPPPSGSLEDILGDVCMASDSTGEAPLDLSRDTNFTTELQSLLTRGVSNSFARNGYSALPVTAFRGIASGATYTGNLSSQQDFYHQDSCNAGDQFCIKVTFVPAGTQNALIGGNTYSIESILDKYIKHLYPISESALGYQKMTNNAGSSPVKNWNLKKTLSGPFISVGTKSQISKRRKAEDTPQRKEEDFQAVLRCSRVNAGLSMDAKRANSIGGAGFVTLSEQTSETLRNTEKPLGPQDAPEVDRYTQCVDTYIALSRKTYYDSFSQDLTDFQRYNAEMIAEIQKILVTLTSMNKKPTQCPN